MLARRSPGTEVKVMRKVQYRMTEQQRALAAENVSLIDWMVGRVVGRSRQGRRTHDDVRSDAAVALCRAASLYDPARGASFPTYASCAIAFAASRSLRSAAKAKSRANSLNHEPASATQGPEDVCISGEIASRLTAAIDRLPARQRVAVELRFGLDGRGERAHHEVARAIGVSVTSAQNITRSAIGALRTLIGETYD